MQWKRPSKKWRRRFGRTKVPRTIRSPPPNGKLARCRSLSRPPMFESVELGHKLTKEQNDAELPGLRSQLLQAHFQLREQSFPVIVIISGADGAGKGAVVHRLNEWLDPRGVETHAFLDPSDEERERPPYWRFWRAMPGRGRIGIFFRSWYSEPLVNRVYGETKGSDFDAALDRIAAFEQMLVDDGAVLVKLWLHLSKAEQKKALKKLDHEGRITPVDWKHFKMYRRFIQASERTIRRTDSGSAPWHLVEATDRRYREFTVGKILLEAIRRRRPETTAKAARAETKAVAKERSVRKPSLSTAGTVLDRVALTQKLTEANYREALGSYQTRLAKLCWAAHEKKRSMARPPWYKAGPPEGDPAKSSFNYHPGLRPLIDDAQSRNHAHRRHPRSPCHAQGIRGCHSREPALRSPGDPVARKSRRSGDSGGVARAPGPPHPRGQRRAAAGGGAARPSSRRAVDRRNAEAVMLHICRSF